MRLGAAALFFKGTTMFVLQSIFVSIYILSGTLSVTTPPAQPTLNVTVAHPQSSLEVQPLIEQLRITEVR